MAKTTNLRKEMSNLEGLERELHLKQLQINRLLNITQAINNNVSNQGLYDMYNSFLSWEMGIKKMTLYIQFDNVWRCVSDIGISKELTEMDISQKLSEYERLKMLEGSETHELIKEFDVVIPVLHNERPIAYTFIGGFAEDEDMYNKVQFHLPDNEFYQLDSIYKPHQSVGGDYFDYVEFKDGTLVFCIADIAGKGLAAALLMANFQANFHSILMASTKLETFVRELNTSLFRITKGDKHLTFFIGVYKRDTGKLTYCNAGHNPPVLFSKNKLDTLREGCTILGSLMNRIDIFKGRQNYPDDFTVLTCKIFK